MPDISKYSPEQPFVPSNFTKVNLGNAFIPSVTMPDLPSPSGVSQGDGAWGFFLRGGKKDPFAGLGIVPGAPAAQTDYWDNQKFSSESAEYQSGDTFKDIGFLIGRDNEDLWSRNRGWWDEGFNTTIRLLDKTGAYALQGIGFLGGLVGIGNKNDMYHSGSAFSDWIAGAGDNGLAQWGADTAEDIDNIYRPIYNEASDRNAGFFKRAFTDLEFWKGDVVDGAAFLLSAYATGSVLQGANLGGAALRGISTLRGLNFAKQAAALSDEGLSGLSAATNLSRGATVAAGEGAAPLVPNVLAAEAGSVVRSVVNEAGNFANAQKINNGITTIINTAAEAMTEAVSLKNELADQLLAEKNPDGSAKYTGEEVRDITARAGKNGFLMNMLVLGPSNLWETKILFGKTPSLSGRNAKNRLVKHGSGILSDAEITKRTFGQRGLDYLGNAAKGVGIEGFWEENIQLAIERLNSQPDNINESFFTNIGKTLNQYGKQTIGALAGDDVEASTSIGIGGIIGGGMSTAQRAGQMKQLKRDVTNYNDAVSSFRNTSKNFYQTNADGTLVLDEGGNPRIDKSNVLSFAASMNKTLEMSELADNLKDKNMNLLHSIVDNENISRLVKAYADNGMADVLFNKLDNAKGFKKEDLVMMGLSADEVKNNARIEEVKRKVTQHLKIYDNVQKNFMVKIVNDDKKGSKANAMKQTLYHLSTRAAHLEELKGKVEDEVQQTSSAIAVRYSSPSDGLVDTLNDLHRTYTSAKKRVDALSTQGPRQITGRLQLTDSSEEVIDLGQGMSVKVPKKDKPIVHPEEIQSVDEQVLNDAVIELNNAESNLKKFILDNKDEVRNIKKNADGTFRYEIAERNRLTYETGQARQQNIAKDIEMARNATLNVHNRISDVRFGERYWDNIYGSRKQTLQDEVENDESTNIEGPLVDETPPAPKTGPSETITPEKAEQMKQNKKDEEELYEEERDLEQEKEFIMSQEEVLTPEQEKRVEEIDDRLDTINKIRVQKDEEEKNESIVDSSVNIKPENKVDYKEVLNKITENKKRVKKFNTHYEVDGKYFRKVSEIIGDNVTVDESAANKGYTVDAIVKAFFAGEIDSEFKKQYVDRISEEAFDEIVKELDSIKAKLTDQGIEVVANNVVVFDEDLQVAGEIDLLGVDKNGNFKIYEISARRPEIYRIYGKSGRGISIRELDGKRLSAYRNLFANQYGVIPDEISVMFPFAITYDKTDINGYIEKAKLKSKIRFVPEKSVEVKLKVFKPIRSGSKFDTFDLFTFFSRTYVPSTLKNVRDKVNFLFRNESFENIKNKLTLKVSDLEGEFASAYEEQQKLLKGEDTRFMPNKAAYLNSFGNRIEFDNLYALRNSKNMALYYDNELVGFMSPIPALAYKDANGNMQVLGPATDQRTYTEVTGNSASTYGDFQKLAKAYLNSYQMLLNELDASQGKEITLTNKVLQESFDTILSYGELDKVKSNETRPLLKDLDYRGVKVGSKKNVVTVLNIDDTDSIQVIMDKTKKTSATNKKLQDIDKWANDNLEQIKPATVDSNGKKVTNYVAVIETPSGEYKIIALREKEKDAVKPDENFVYNLGDKFTASVKTTVFKNQNMQMIPKVNETTTNINLKDTEILGKVFTAEDIESIEQFGLDASDLVVETNDEKVNSFLNNLTPAELSDINGKFAAFPQTAEELARDIMDEYNSSTWSSIDDFLNDLKNCP